MVVSSYFVFCGGKGEFGRGSVVFRYMFGVEGWAIDVCVSFFVIAGLTMYERRQGWGDALFFYWMPDAVVL